MNKKHLFLLFTLLTQFTVLSSSTFAYDNSNQPWVSDIKGTFCPAQLINSERPYCPGRYFRRLPYALVVINNKEPGKACYSSDFTIEIYSDGKVYKQFCSLKLYKPRIWMMSLDRNTLNTLTANVLSLPSLEPISSASGTPDILCDTNITKKKTYSVIPGNKAFVYKTSSNCVTSIAPGESTQKSIIIEIVDAVEKSLSTMKP